MNKFVLTGWLMAPIAIVSGLWFMIDRDAARKSRDQFARLALASNSRVAEPAPASPSTMIRPEYLPQGFTLIVKDLTGLASTQSPIHLASSWNGWDPSDRTQQLEPRSDGRWQIVIPKGRPDTPIAFKFTRGSWDLEELDTELKVINNRSLPPIDKSKLGPEERPVFEFEIPKWGDQRPTSAQRPDLNPYYEIKSDSMIRRLQVPGGGVVADNGQRDVLVYLPPGYDAPENKGRSYPVLYMQDGQNLFMKLPNVPAEWGLDETADRLIKSGAIEPLIIVGIPHQGAARASEYSPFEIVQGQAPRGGEYVRWITGTVMPRVERAFRVKTGPENTAIGGSSLGALIAAEAGARHPDQFGKLYLESMSGLGKSAVTLKHFESIARWPARVYFGMGTMEAGKDEASRESNQFYLTHAAEFADRLKAAGATVDANNTDAEHTEAAWASRAEAALKFLFPATGK
jgi:predicted alpha/beta superfamily hydrolase